MITRQQIEHILGKVLPAYRLTSCEWLVGGTRNENWLLCFDGRKDRLVLRLHACDPVACQKEMDLHRVTWGRVPVPEIIHADSRGDGEIGPYLLKRYAEGVTFQELKAKGDLQDLAEAARAVGATLAGLRSLPLPSGAPLERPALVAAVAERCSSSPLLRQRLGGGESDRLGQLIDHWLPHLSPLDQEQALAHGDFGGRNIVVRRDGRRWVVSGILDWELAFAGSLWWDASRFLCYERRARPVREPHFSAGYREGGGLLPENWSEFSRVLNAVSAAEGLSRPDLPEHFVPELTALVVATMDGWDPP